MAQPHLSDALLQSLHQRAAQENVTIPELLQRWLNTPVTPPPATPLPPSLSARALEVSNASVLVLDVMLPDAPIVYSNPAFERLTGYTREEVLGKSCRFMHGTDNQQPELNLLRDAVRAKRNYVVTLRNYRKDGTMFWNEQHVAPIIDEQGHLTHLVCVGHDVTRTIRYQEQQSRQERQFAVGPVVFMRWNRPDNSPVFLETYVSANVDRFGYQPEEFTSGQRRWVDVIHPEDRERILRETNAIRAARIPLAESHYRIHTASGEIRWIYEYSLAIYDDPAETSRGYLVDITDINQTQETLRKSEAFVSSVLRNALNGIIVFRAIRDASGSIVDFEYLMVNPAMERIGGLSAAELVGKRQLDIYPKDRTNGIYDHFVQVVETGEPHTFEQYFPGSRTWALLSVVKLEDGIAVSFQDITELKRVEAALRKNEAFLSGILQSSVNGIMVFRAVRNTTGSIIDFEYVMVNPAMEQITGIPAAELVGKRQLELYPYDRDNGIYDHMMQVVETGEPHTFEQYVDHPGRRWGMYAAVKLEDGVVVGYNDITGLKMTEEALRKNETFLSSVLQSSLNGIMVCRAVRDENSTIVDFEWVMVNPAMEQISGLTSAQMVGKRQLELYPDDRDNGIHNHLVQVVETGVPQTFEHYFAISQTWALFSVVKLEDGVAVGYNDITGLKQTEEALRQAKDNYDDLVARIPGMVYRLRTFSNGYTVYEYISPRVREFHGLEPADVYADGNILMNQLHPEDVRTAMQISERAAIKLEPIVWEGRYNVNGRIRWLRRESRPERMDDGSIVWNGIELDMTLEIEAKQARADAEAALNEQQRLEAMLHQEQRTGNLHTQLIRTLSHEFRTPLAIMTTSLNMLEHYFDRLAPEERLRRIGNIHTQIRQLTILLDDTTETLRSMVHGAGFNPHPVNLEQLCQVILNEMQTTIGEYHRLRFISDGQVSSALIDDRLISRVLVNLLSNAVKYSPPDTEIRLDLALSPDAIILRVTDQGLGIAPNDLARLFEPFFRAKEVLSLPGTGLGLPIVKDCVELHGGTIEVDSVVGRGTTFTVSLPLPKEIMGG